MMNNYYGVFAFKANYSTATNEELRYNAGAGTNGTVGQRSLDRSELDELVNSKISNFEVVEASQKEVFKTDGVDYSKSSFSPDVAYIEGSADYLKSIDSEQVFNPLENVVVVKDHADYLNHEDMNLRISMVELSPELNATKEDIYQVALTAQKRTIDISYMLEKGGFIHSTEDGKLQLTSKVEVGEFRGEHILYGPKGEIVEISNHGNPETQRQHYESTSNLSILLKSGQEIQLDVAIHDELNQGSHQGISRTIAIEGIGFDKLDSNEKEEVLTIANQVSKLSQSFQEQLSLVESDIEDMESELLNTSLIESVKVDFNFSSGGTARKISLTGNGGVIDSTFSDRNMQTAFSGYLSQIGLYDPNFKSDYGQNNIELFGEDNVTGDGKFSKLKGSIQMGELEGLPFQAAIVSKQDQLGQFLNGREYFAEFLE